MILIALMWARIPPGPDNFKRVIKYQTLRTSFYGGFESVANIVFLFETPEFDRSFNFGTSWEVERGGLSRGALI